jgi:hypothetical protein
MRVLAFIALALVAGCGSFDREPHTVYFEPLESGFKYVVKTNMLYPEASREAENVRMGWMEHYAEQNGLCPGGFAITERKVARGTAGIGAEAGQIFYTAQCS